MTHNVVDIDQGTSVCNTLMMRVYST